MTAKAKVRIEGENATAAAWRQVMGDAQSASRKMSNVFKTAFAGISLAVVANMGRQAIEAGDNLNKFAIRAGLAGKEASTLAYAANQADVELSQLTLSVQKMQVFLSKAASGEKENVEALDALGIKLKDIKDLNADEQFELIAEQISRLKSEEDKARAATEVFGKAGGDLLPMFEQGAEGIKKAREEAEKLGLTFSSEELKTFADADDAIKRMSASWSHLAGVLTLEFAPAITYAMDRLSGVPKDIYEQIADQEELIEDLKHARGQNAAALQAEALKKLNSLRQRGLGQSSRDMGVMPQASALPAPTERVDKAAIERGKKTADALEKQAEETAAALREVDRHLNAELDKARDEKMDKFFEDEDRKDQYIKDRAALMKELEDARTEEFTESMQVVRDGFLNAFDDMVNTGKFKWKELLKFMVAEFARMQIVKLFDGMMKGGGGGFGGFFGDLWGGLKSIFGGARADGGDIQSGKFYTVGERGPEVLAAGMNGSIIPNHALGGAMPAPVINIDARGSSIESVKLLQQMAPGIIDAAVAKMTYLSNRRMLPVR